MKLHDGSALRLPDEIALTVWLGLSSDRYVVLKLQLRPIRLSCGAATENAI